MLNCLSEQYFNEGNPLQYFFFSDVWSGVVSIPAAVNVEFRYFVCVIVEPDGEKYLDRQIIVRRWETGFKPRVISKNGKSCLFIVTPGV